MKKFLLVTLLMSLGLISCSSCAKAPQTEPAPVPTPTATVPAPVPTATTPPPAPSTVVAQENWSFDPGEGWKVLMPPNNEAIKTALLNPEKKLLVIFTKEEFLGTQEQYALLNIRATRDSGATLVGSSTVEVNGVKYTLIETFKVNSNGVKVNVWQWLTVKSSRGYVFTCGGPSSLNPSAQTDCQAVASTLKID